MPTPSLPKILYDAFGTYEAGVNQGASPLLLPPNTMAGSLNVTVRGNYATHRSAFYKRPVTYDSDATRSAVETGYFQGCTDQVCLDDDGNASVVALISSRLFQFKIEGTVVNCHEVAIAGGVILPVQPQAWLWQTELWVIVQDGLNNPIFFNLQDGTAVRSNYGTSVPFSTTLTAAFTIPDVGQNVVVSVTDASNMVAGDVLTASNYTTTTNGYGQLQVLSIAVNDVTCVNLTCTPSGGQTTATTVLSWTHKGAQLPPGRTGDYGLGRNWTSLVDGKQFVAGDIVGGPSGTQQYNFRDAVLNITENLFIVGGGNFTVPGNAGAIKAMRFVAILDVSLGQGPLQVFTNDRVFSCNAPVDRLTWQSITNPILTESLIANGAKGQHSTRLANGDSLFRSVDGFRSLILARREFSSWGNVPISFEVVKSLIYDDPGLLTYGSSLNFDNRMLCTVGTTAHAQGTYFQGLLALNFDPLSTIRGKEPAVWDGLWTGMNVLQLVGGEVTGVDRAFAFVLNIGSPTAIQFWEIKKTPIAAAPQIDDAFFDRPDGQTDVPINWQLDSPSMRFGVPAKDRKYMALNNGELHVGYLTQTVSFNVQYRADQYPCWTSWLAWTECQSADASDSKPGFRPRMGLGQPSAMPCDASNHRPLRNGFTFQTRITITGHCVLIGGFFEAIEMPMPTFAPMACVTNCQT